LPDPKLGCQPAVAPFWLGAAAMTLTFSFFGFLDSRLLFAMPFSHVDGSSVGRCEVIGYCYLFDRTARDEDFSLSQSFSIDIHQTGAHGDLPTRQRKAAALQKTR
jgi:hypothetical protein